MIVLKRSGYRPINFHLMAQVLRQPVDEIYRWRQVKRSQLAQLFRSQPLTHDHRYPNGTRFRRVDAKFGSGRLGYPELWVAVLYGSKSRICPGQLSIGCVQFTLAETKRIRRWALAKH